MLSQNTLQILGALLSLVLMALPFLKTAAGQVADRLASRLPANAHAIMTRVAQEAVQAVEQLSTVAKEAGGIPLADRKSKAMEFGSTLLAHFGVKVSPQALATLDTYIESAVSMLAPSGVSGQVLDPTHVGEADASFLLDTAAETTAPVAAV